MLVASGRREKKAPEPGRLFNYLCRPVQYGYLQDIPWVPIGQVRSYAIYERNEHGVRKRKENAANYVGRYRVLYI